MFIADFTAQYHMDATSDMAIELPPEELVKGGDQNGENLKSFVVRVTKAAHTCEQEWKRVIDLIACLRHTPRNGKPLFSMDLALLEVEYKEAQHCLFLMLKYPYPVVSPTCFSRKSLVLV